MRKLNLPAYEFKYQNEGKDLRVLDVYRKRFVKLTPEEEVRQRFARYLVEEKGFPASLLMTEYSLKLNKLSRRCDILVHKPVGHPALLVECKAPEVSISQATFDQVARYNLAFRVSYLIVTNGLKHYCCQIDFETEKISFLSEIPAYAELVVNS
ncbi:MAG: type I restriction enzyme HsdR N-terminal domain-containing protein [Bacteroidales bacterium]|nr:type I restriction enzyme HsdR N-terminal domain-containing protein [Bacteroidales bacterium]